MEFGNFGRFKREIGRLHRLCEYPSGTKGGIQNLEDKLVVCNFRTIKKLKESVVAI